LRWVKTGLPGAMVATGVVIAGQSYDGQYAFRNGQFTQFHASTGEYLLNNRSKALYERTVLALRQALGAPTDERIKETPTMLSADTEWRSPAGRASVTISPVTAQTSQLLINFQVDAR
jgi:hypothetical protein